MSAEPGDLGAYWADCRAWPAGATKTATFAISASVMSRRGWALLAIRSYHCAHVIPWPWREARGLA